MSDTNFVNGTVITADWLNAINDFVYDFPMITQIPGADPTGATDSTAAFNAVKAVAALTGAFVCPPPGAYWIDNFDPQGVDWIAPSTFTRETSTYTSPGVVFLHKGSNPMLVPSGGGWSMRGFKFYDPLQPGTGATPVVRPSLIKPNAPDRAIDFRFIDCTVVNCYNFLDIPEGSLSGAIKVMGCDIYAIQFVFWFKAWVPETIQVSNNLFTVGVAQTFAKDANGAMLAKWTGANGSYVAVDITTGPVEQRSVDGFKSNNNLIYGYAVGYNLVNGSINVSTATGDTYDGVATLIRTRGTASITGLSFVGGKLYSYRFGDDTFASTGIDLASSGLHRFSIGGGFRFEVCKGSWFVDIATGASRIDIDAFIGPWGTADAVTGDQYAFRIANETGVYNLRLPLLENIYADGVGLSVVECEQITLIGSHFAGCKAPIAIDASVSSFATINIGLCLSTGTSGANSLQNNSSANVYDCGSRWDQATNVTPSV